MKSPVARWRSTFGPLGLAMLLQVRGWAFNLFTAWLFYTLCEARFERWRQGLRRSLAISRAAKIA